MFASRELWDRISSDFGRPIHAWREGEAVRRGVKIVPITSSGLDDQGEVIFRQLAQFTLGRFVFLTYYDEAGQPSSGPGTGTDHHVEPQDCTVEVLDSLIVRLAMEELAGLRDAMIRYWDQ